MQPECFRVKVPDSARLAGFTATGQRVRVVPGEHVVHRVKPKVPLDGVIEALRFLGADEIGRDVHVPVCAHAELGDLLPPVEGASGMSELPSAPHVPTG